MKTYYHFAIIICFTLFINLAFSQSKSYTIKLSNPEENGFLKVEVYNASIRVVGHDAKYVKLNIIDKRSKRSQKKGASEFFFQILEDDNKVSIKNRDNSPPRGDVKGLELELFVPKNFSTKLSTYFGPKIQVSGINGEIEASGYFTDVDISDTQSSVIGSTNQGNIVVKVSKLMPSKAYFISGYKGNVSVILPDGVKATLLMDNYFNKYVSDFELSLNTSNKYRSLNFISRDINGGGNEIKLVNYFGKIFIKKM